MIERNVDAMAQTIAFLFSSFASLAAACPARPSVAVLSYSQSADHSLPCNIINKNEAKRDAKPNEFIFIDQEEKFEFFDAEASGDWTEEDYCKNVRVWAEFLVESDQYFRRVNKFFDEHFNTGEVNS